MTLEHPILLGVVGGAHGIKGEVRIRSFTDNPTDINSYGPLTDAKGNRYTIKTARVQKTVVVATIAEVTDRNHAERLNGTELYVDRSMLPEDDEDAFYQADMVGMDVETVAGESVGTVFAFHDFGAGEVVEIKPPRGPTVMIPFSEAAIPDIDMERGVMVVEPLAAGLLDAADDGVEIGEEPDGKPANPDVAAGDDDRR